MRHSHGLLGLLLVGMVAISACSSAAPMRAEKGSAAPAPGEAARAAPSTPAPSMPAPDPSKAGVPAAGRNSNPLPPGYAGSATNEDRKIIMNAEIQVKVKSVEDALKAITSSVSQYGGYVQETRQEGTRQNGRTIHLTVRVPADRYTPLVAQVLGLGEDPIWRESTADVTANYLDLEARTKSREVHLAQLQKLYEKGGTIKEMMELEAEIARVTADLESLKGQFRYLSNQVAYSTVSARLYEAGAPTPIQPPKGVWERMERGFINSWNQVVNFTGNFLVFLVSAVPVIAYAAVLGSSAYLIYRGVRRIRRNPPAS